MSLISVNLYWVSPGSGRSWRNFALMKCWSLRGSFDGTPDWGTVGSRWGGLQDQRTNNITTDCEHHLLSKPIADLKCNIWIKMTHHMLLPLVRKTLLKKLKASTFFFQQDDVSVCFKHCFFFFFEDDRKIILFWSLCIFVHLILSILILYAYCFILYLNLK